uniref:Derlin n=1 Tax=Panagrellus redivivus TaxID=6233 RepID=A0A7E4V1P4_PANRE
MVLTAVASTLFCFNVVVNLACGFTGTTRRGFLIAHWCFINWLYAVEWHIFCLTPVTSGLDVLYPLATVLIALDHIAVVSSPSEKLCAVSRWLFVFLLITLDSLCLLMLIEFRYEMLLMMLMLVTFMGCLLYGIRRGTKYSFKELYEYSTDSLYSEPTTAFSCFGHYGWLLYGSVFFRLLREVVPALHSHVIFNYFLYIGLCLGTLDFLALPAVFGGFLNSLKVVGAALGDCSTPKSASKPKLKRVSHDI